MSAYLTASAKKCGHPVENAPVLVMFRYGDGDGYLDAAACALAIAIEMVVEMSGG